MPEENEAEKYSGSDFDLWFACFTAALTGSGALRSASAPATMAAFCGEVADAALEEVRRRRSGPTEASMFFEGPARS